MIRAACHCGAVRLVMDPAPAWVLDCNCSICRRYGTLWAYAWDRIDKRPLGITLIQGEGSLEPYIWGDREIGFYRCRGCGCVTHHVALDNPAPIRAVNARMFVEFDPASVTVHRSDKRPHRLVLDTSRRAGLGRRAAGHAAAGPRRLAVRPSRR